MFLRRVESPIKLRFGDPHTYAQAPTPGALFHQKREIHERERERDETLPEQVQTLRRASKRLSPDSDTSISSECARAGSHCTWSYARRSRLYFSKREKARERERERETRRDSPRRVKTLRRASIASSSFTRRSAVSARRVIVASCVDNSSSLSVGCADGEVSSSPVYERTS